MGNKIEGAQSGFDYLSDAAAGFFGIGESDKCAQKPAAKTEKSAPKESSEKAAAEALEDLPDAPDSFWDAVGGALSKAGSEIGASVEKAGADIADSLADAAGEVVQAGAKSALQTVAQARQGVQDLQDTAAEITRTVGAKMLSDASDALNEIAQIPEDLSAAGVEIFLQAEEARVEFAQALDRAIENHPPEVVGEAAREMMEGTWDFASDLVTTLAHQSVKGAKLVGNATIDAYLTVDDARSEAKTALYDEVVVAGARFAIEHSDALKTAGHLVESAADNPVVDALVMVSDFTMMGTLSSTRSAALKFANFAQSAEKTGQEVLNNPETRRLFTTERNFSHITADLEKLPEGDRFRENTRVEVSVHGGVGGKVGGSVGVEATRVGEQSFQVAIEVEALMGAGVGKDLIKKGISVDLKATPGAQVILQFDGEHAAESAARVMAAVTTRSVADILRLRGVQGGEIVGATGTPMSGGAQLSAMGFKSYAGMSGAAQFKEIDGTKYVGVSATAHPMSVGFDSSSAQLSDTLAEGWLNDPTTGNPAMDRMLSELPANFVTDFKKVHGRLDGVKIGAKGEVAGALFKAADESGMMRAELEVKVDLTLGRSTLKCSAQVVIPDLERLADALDMNAELLFEKLSSGELSAQDLAQSGQDIADLIEYSGLKVVGEKASLNAISIAGVGRESGSIHSLVLVDGSETIDGEARLRELIDYMPGQSAQKSAASTMSDRAQNELLLAHAGRI